MSANDYPTFCSACHEPRNSAELNNAGTCRQCVARYWRPEALEPQCECGRGPILPGNMVPEVCAYCFAERYCAECGEPLSVAPGRACRPGTVHDIASEWGTELAPLVARAMQSSTVKRATLFDGVVDTYRTEAELNGYRASQGALL